MENKYLKKFDEKQKRDIEFYIEKRQEQYGNDYFTFEYLQKEFQSIFTTFHNQYKNEKKSETELKKGFPGVTNSLGNILYDHIFYDRIINDDLETFYNGLYTAQRIHFLGDRYGSMGYWGTDASYMIIRLRNGLAVYDEQLIHGYMSSIPGPFETGYAFYVSLANGLYLIFQSKLKEASDYLTNRLAIKSHTNYERAVLSALKAIADKDEAQFVSGINGSLSLYSRQNVLGLANFLSLETLGLHNIAVKVWGTVPKEPVSKYWDSDFFHYQIAAKHQVHFLPEVSDISPLFASWLAELPSDISIGDLILDLENKI